MVFFSLCTLDAPPLVQMQCELLYIFSPLALIPSHQSEGPNHKVILITLHWPVLHWRAEVYCISNAVCTPLAGAGAQPYPHLWSDYSCEPGPWLDQFVVNTIPPVFLCMTLSGKYYVFEHSAPHWKSENSGCWFNFSAALAATSRSCRVVGFGELQHVSDATTSHATSKSCALNIFGQLMECSALYCWKKKALPLCARLLPAVYLPKC